MKYAIVVVTALAAVSMVSEGFAASAPQFVGVIEEFDPSTGKYTELERQTPAQNHDVSQLGLGSFDAFLEYPGEKSPVRFKSGASIAFVLCVQHQDVDPQDIIQFWRLVPKDGRRTLPTAHAGSGVFSGTTTDVTGGQRVLFTAEIFGPTLFKFVPTQPLPPGEYSVSTTTDVEGFNFGIDP